MPRSQLELEDFLPYRLSIASNAVSQLIARTYEDTFALKMPEWRLIAVLADEKQLSQQELVLRTKMDKVTVSRAAQVLERRNLIKRIPNPEDGRALRLSLTAEGRKIHAKVGPAALELEAQMLSELSHKEVTQLKGLLRRIEKAAESSLLEETDE
jgi:DNA-binding MarR family transcriptional regulator